MIDSGILKSEEKAMLALRALYKQYGYMPFKMSKFEEYDLYMQNKDFLVSDSVITFNDTNGRLMALKPDVTLSIIKNTVEEAGCKQRVYYNENVYRISPRTHQFKEIMQMGLECIGSIDILDVFEVVYLAAKSLDAVSPDFMLDISHMGILSAVIEAASENEVFKKKAAALIAEKNKHETEALCYEYSINEEYTNMLVGLIETYGDADFVLSKLRDMKLKGYAEQAFDELETLCKLLKSTEYSGKIHLDFSVINDMNYYNGIVFKGFLNGISESVLSGGEYDMLMQRMQKYCKAIGFALYLDSLEELEDTKVGYDVDVLLLYGRKNAAEEVVAKKKELLSNGLSVSLQREIPRKIRYKELIDLTEEVLK